MSKDFICMGSIKEENAISSSGRGLNKGNPFCIFGRNDIKGVDSLQLDATREVAVEISSINFSLQDVTSNTQANNIIVRVSRNTRTSSLPSMTLVATTTRQKDKITRTEMDISGLDGSTTVTNEG